MSGTPAGAAAAAATAKRVKKSEMIRSTSTLSSRTIDGQFGKASARKDLRASHLKRTDSTWSQASRSKSPNHATSSSASLRSIIRGSTMRGKGDEVDLGPHATRTRSSISLFKSAARSAEEAAAPGSPGASGSGKSVAYRGLGGGGNLRKASGIKLARVASKVAFKPDPKVTKNLPMDDPYIQDAIAVCSAFGIVGKQTRNELLKQVGALAWAGGEMVQLYISRCGILERIMEALEDPRETVASQVIALQALSLCVISNTQSQNRMRELGTVSVLADLMLSHRVEVRQWAAHAMMVMLCGNSNNQQTALRIPNLKRRLTIVRGDDWSTWSHNEAEELVAMLLLDEAGGLKPASGIISPDGWRSPEGALSPTSSSSRR